MFRDDIAVIDHIKLKGRKIRIPKRTTKKVLNQLHNNQMGIKNETLGSHIKKCSTCLEFQQIQLKEKLIDHEVSARPREVVSVNMFSLYNKSFLCIVSYHRKFHIIKMVGGLSADNIVLAFKVIFFFRTWAAQEDNVSCRWEFYCRDRATDSRINGELSSPAKIGRQQDTNTR